MIKIDLIFFNAIYIVIHKYHSPIKMAWNSYKVTCSVKYKTQGMFLVALKKK